MSAPQRDDGALWRPPYSQTLARFPIRRRLIHACWAFVAWCQNLQLGANQLRSETGRDNSRQISVSEPCKEVAGESWIRSGGVWKGKHAKRQKGSTGIQAHEVDRPDVLSHKS
jgi:hypothetical protein